MNTDKVIKINDEELEKVSGGMAQAKYCYYCEKCGCDVLPGAVGSNKDGVAIHTVCGGKIITRMGEKPLATIDEFPNKKNGGMSESGNEII